MIGEINVGGVFFTAALATACLASLLLLIVRKILNSQKLYRFFWHRYIVDLAIFLILWACIAFAMSTH
ncbi:DUF1656 domain-containing protein [Burkholderia gladioli]|uniref:DUF1656 domain-containing protein n=1 Tax=Burkholderia gladioli TaxID=28095 RepID=UPI00155F666E|nr:DUF1656 domain-containing protein [Burkholderia gladioli]